METKYKFAQASQEDVDKFNVEFRQLLDKHSLVAETQPQIGRIGESGEFCIKGVMVLSKKIEIIEEKKVEGAIPSTNPEVNPALNK